MAVVVKGAKKLQYQLKRFPKDAKLAVAFGSFDAALKIMTLAKLRAPVNQRDPELAGRLRNSGYVEDPMMMGAGRVSVEMGFGGPSKDYMVRQHETHRTQAFFFSSAVDDVDTKRIVAEYVNHFISTGKVPSKPNRGGIPPDPWAGQGVAFG